MVKNYQPHKDEIIRLYKDRNIDDVVEVMKQRGFSASRRWYLSKFRDWNCQKTSNRKKIANRQSRAALVVEIENNGTEIADSRNPENNAAPEVSQQMASAPGVTFESTRWPYFLEKCPRSSQCPEAPFLTLDDYTKHQKSHHAQVSETFMWEAAQSTTGSIFQLYLSELGRSGRQDLLSDLLFSRCHDLTSPLDFLDCAEVLLRFGLDKHCAICTINAIVAREVTFLEAKSTLERLASVARQILGREQSHYPHVIGWIFEFMMACGSDDETPVWDTLQTRLCRIQEHASLPPSLKEYVGTFTIQNFIDRLRLCPQESPSFDSVAEVCKKFSIPLDIGYIALLHRLNIERSYPILRANFFSDTQSNYWTTELTSRRPFMPPLMPPQSLCVECLGLCQCSNRLKITESTHARSFTSFDGNVLSPPIRPPSSKPRIDFWQDATDLVH